MVNSFSELIDELGGVTAFANAVGMKPNTAKMAKSRNSLSPEWFASVVSLAQEKRLPEITMERLVEMAADRRKAARAA